LKNKLLSRRVTTAYFLVIIGVSRRTLNINPIRNTSLVFDWMGYETDLCKNRNLNRPLFNQPSINTKAIPPLPIP
jgi:hypothetical protein